MKTFLSYRLILVVLLFTSSLSAQNSFDNTALSSQLIYHKLLRNPKLSVAARLQFISNQFLGKPYLLAALGEGNEGTFDKAPLYRFDSFDCETFVDTVLALALGSNPQQFKQLINKIRYKNGQISYQNRNHFTGLDWNRNNQKQGFIKDITFSITGVHDKPIAKIARALINKPAWYQKKPIEAIKIDALSLANKKLLLEQLQNLAYSQPQSIEEVPYLPLDILFNKSGAPKLKIFTQIPHGSIIEIVRPNWNITEQIGTRCNISHLGFAFWQDGILLFRQASSIDNRVIDTPLIDYLKRARTSPTIKGINIQKVIGRVQ